MLGTPIWVLGGWPTVPHEPGLSTAYENRGAIFRRVSPPYSRLIDEPEVGIYDLSLLASIRPIEWSNVILYGEYKLNRDLIK
jgi:hypothetical protein